MSPLASQMRSTPLLGPVPWPLEVAISRSSPTVARALGYQSVGMKPRKTERHIRSNPVCNQARSIENRYGIDRGISNEQTLAIRRLCQRDRRSAGKLLIAQGGGE